MVETRQIRRLVKQDAYRLTDHARRRCRSRRITIADVEMVIANGRIIETYIDDFGYECYLIYGERFNGDEVHVAGKIVDDVFQINTVYFPHEHLWEVDRIRKRR